VLGGVERKKRAVGMVTQRTGKSSRGGKSTHAGRFENRGPDLCTKDITRPLGRCVRESIVRESLPVRERRGLGRWQGKGYERDIGKGGGIVSRREAYKVPKIGFGAVSSQDVPAGNSRCRSLGATKIRHTHLSIVLYVRELEDGKKSIHNG